MFANLFHHFVSDAQQHRMDVATLDDRLLDDVGLTRGDAGAGRVDVRDVAASSAFPVHDVWSKHPVVAIADSHHG